MGRRKGQIAKMAKSSQLLKDRNRKPGYRSGIGDDSFLHTTELDDGTTYNRINFQSVTEQNNLEDFLNTAEMAGRDFTAERQDIQIISDPGRDLHLTQDDMDRISKAQETHRAALQIPRRPPWDEDTSKEELILMERDSFTDWRRQLKMLEEKEHIQLTPYEKNLDFWRQLWRVIERSDVVVQIVDARNPLLFRCEDLETYVKQVDPLKTCMLLVNKADFLNTRQRDQWVEYFNSTGIRAVFFSAKTEKERQEASVQETTAADLRPLSEEKDEELDEEEEEDDDEDVDDEKDDDKEKEVKRESKNAKVLADTEELDDGGDEEEEEDDDDDEDDEDIDDEKADDKEKGVKGEGKNAKVQADTEELDDNDDEEEDDDDKDGADVNNEKDDDKEKEVKGEKNAKVQADTEELDDSGDEEEEEEDDDDKDDDEKADNKEKDTRGESTAKVQADTEELDDSGDEEEDDDEDDEDVDDEKADNKKKMVKGESTAKVQADTEEEEEEDDDDDDDVKDDEDADTALGTNSSRIVSSDELLDIFRHLAHRSAAQRSRVRDGSVSERSDGSVSEGSDRSDVKEVKTVGMVGYPNVGKSSTINVILEQKKLAVSATPGRTKHFQTLYVDPHLILCDCPGLVFPSFVATKAHLVINGILPIDELRNHTPPVSLVCEHIPRSVLEATYSIMITPPSLDDPDPNRPPTSEELLNAYGGMRGFMTPRGLPDCPRASRYILKDYVKGKLLYCEPPPGIDGTAFQDETRHEQICRSRKEVFTKTKIQPKSDIDREFFSQVKKRSKAHSRGVTGVSDFVRTDTLQHTSQEVTEMGDLASGQSSSMSSLASQAGGKSWKKHNNRNKKEKLRRIHRDLDIS